MKCILRNFGPWRAENAGHGLGGRPYRNGIQNTLRRKIIGSRTSESWQKDIKIPEEGQEKPGTNVVTIYKGKVVPVRN
jgi:hypothetical protein